MSLTKEHKDGLIANLYGPMFDYIEGIVKHEDEPGIFARLFKKPAKKSALGLAFELRQAALYDYEAKAKFESRISAILDAYLEGRVLAEPLPESQPVAVVDEAQRQAHIASVMKYLADFKWEELKSEDYATARRAWFYLDWLKAACAVNAETREAYLNARTEAKID